MKAIFSPLTCLFHTNHDLFNRLTQKLPQLYWIDLPAGITQGREKGNGSINFLISFRQALRLGHPGSLDLGLELTLLGFQLSEYVLIFKSQIRISQDHVPTSCIEVLLDFDELILQRFGVNFHGAMLRLSAKLFPQALNGLGIEILVFDRIDDVIHNNVFPDAVSVAEGPC